MNNRNMDRNMGQELKVVNNFEWKTVNISTIAGIVEAERLKENGWKIIRSGLFQILFERKKSEGK